MEKRRYQPIKRKLCSVDGCQLPVFAKGFCIRHQRLRTDKKPKGLKPRKPSGEKDFFLEVWDSTPINQRKSFISGINLTRYEDTNVFHCIFSHTISKGAYPKYKFFKDNICLLDPFEHHLLDSCTKQQRDEYAEDMKKNGITVSWDKLYKKREELLAKYPNID